MDPTRWNRPPSPHNHREDEGGSLPPTVPDGQAPPDSGLPLPGDRKAPFPFLHILDFNGKRTFPLDREVIRVGRQIYNHIQFIESHVSKKHAEILRRGDQFLIVDLGSKSGVYVNGRRVQKQALEEKDVITLGTLKIPSLRFSRSVFEPDPLSHSKILVALKDAAGGQGLEKLARFLGFHRMMGQRINLNEILENVVDLSTEQIDAERGFLILRGPEDSLEYRVARERNKRPIPPPEILVSETIVRDTRIPSPSSTSWTSTGKGPSRWTGK